VAKLSVSDKDSTEFYEIVITDAIPLPAVVPIRGADGELIPHATAEVYRDDNGNILAIMRIPGVSKVTALLAHRNALSVCPR
jgi:hypothetical protein